MTVLPRTVVSRFELRNKVTASAPVALPETTQDASIFSYAQAGSPTSGESGRMGQGGASV